MARPVCHREAMIDGADDVVGWIRARVARVLGEGVPDDAALTGAGGLGFDSVRVVELLLACETRFEVTLAAEEVLAGAPLTVATLAARVRGEA